MGPFFSIISPIYNCKDKLDKTIESVLSQSCDDFEYLLMDGDSSDGTRERVVAIDDHRVRLFSKPDRGVYDAMNQGIAAARGKYLYFLGAGDQLLPGALQRVRDHLPDNDTTLAYGNVWTPGDYIHDGEFSRMTICFKDICHQSIFYGRGVFEIVGKYDLKYPTAADWALNIQCFGHKKIAILYIPIVVATFEGGGLSEKPDTSFYADHGALIRKNLGLATFALFKWAGWKADREKRNGTLRRSRAIEHRHSHAIPECGQ